MKKQQLDHFLRAAGRITKEKQLAIVGSQSFHGKRADLPDQLLALLDTTPVTAAARKSIRLRIQTGFAHRGKPA